MSEPWIFMGIDRSHFSAKLRPAVRYKRIHCVEYPPNNALITERTGVGFVPVLISPEDEMLQDTTGIIDALEERFPEPPLLPPNPDDLMLCRLFELYADEFFPMVSMRTRWAYPANEAEMRRAFAAFSGSLERGDAIANLMSSYLPMLGVTEKTIPAIDAHLDDLLDALCAHFREQPFLLGARLSLADCALMGPLYAHLYLDQVTRAKLYAEAIEVCMWIERCNRPMPESMGEFPDGTRPESLDAVLAVMAEALPMLGDLETAWLAWAATEASPGAELPRGVAQYKSELRGVPVTAGARSYVPWKIQRLRAAAVDASTSAHTRMEQLGIASLIDRRDGPTIVKRDFKLYVDM